MSVNSRGRCVQRQYSGTAGRVESCQLRVFLAYATSKRPQRGSLVWKAAMSPFSLTGASSGARRSRLFRRNRPLGGRHPAVEVGLRELRPRRNVGKLAEEVKRLCDPRATEHGGVATRDDFSAKPLNVVHYRLELLAIQQGRPGGN